MAAYSVTPNGRLVRWHYPTLDECAEAKCERRHATKAELDTFTDEAIAFRAGAVCAASEPHGVVGDDWPCPACLARVRTASAPASATTGGLSTSFGGADGAAGARALGPPSGQGAGGSTSQTDNSPGTRNPRGAEGATAIARKQSMP